MKAKTLTLAVVTAILTVTGCKIDAPVYPTGTIYIKRGTDDGTNPGDNGNTDPGTDAIYTVGIGAGDSFIYQIDNGSKVTMHNILTLDQDPDPTIPFAGNTNISAHSLDDKEVDISFSVGVNDALGIFPISQFSLKSKTMDYEKDGEGTVKFTSFTEDSDGFDIVKGYFKVNVVDNHTGLKHIITGSYNTGE
jgi:hypothetical protein